VGTTSTTNNIRAEQKLAVVGAGSNIYPGASFTGYAGTGNYYPLIDIQKSAGTTDGSMTALSSGDGIGAIAFRGSDGTNFKNSVILTALVDGTVASNQVPGALRIETASSSGTVTERMRIDSAGNVGIGMSSPAGRLTLQYDSSTTYTSASRGDAWLQIMNLDSTPDVFAGIELRARGTGSDGAANILCIDVGTGSGDLAFSTRGSNTYAERMRVTSNGYLRMASGSGGIQFNGDSAAANALDDYEEGTWTPTGNGITYNLPEGHYVKIGNVVTAMARVTFPSTASGSVALIQGLPFATKSNMAAGSIALTDYGSSDITVSASGTDFLIRTHSNVSITNANLSTKFIYCSATYIVL
jgi:hypothetical protein